MAQQTGSCSQDFASLALKKSSSEGIEVFSWALRRSQVCIASMAGTPPPGSAHLGEPEEVIGILKAGHEFRYLLGFRLETERIVSKEFWPPNVPLRRKRICWDLAGLGAINDCLSYRQAGGLPGQPQHPPKHTPTIATPALL